MERRGCGLGCIIAGLGVLLGLCLLPYLISSAYSIVSALLQVPVATTWLWGDWLNGIVGQDRALYMIMAEGPICCGGVIVLLLVVLGAVLMLSGQGSEDEIYGDEEVDELYE